MIIGTPVDINIVLKNHKHHDLRKFINDFVDGDCYCVEIDYSDYASIESCRNCLNVAIRRCGKKSLVGVCKIRGKLYMCKTIKLAK